MTRHELLNPRDHASLRVREPAAGGPHFVQIVAQEFASAATCCPILFTKEAATGDFFAGAMFGFKPGENLLQADASRSAFAPLVLQRDGFFISGEQIAIDRENPRFSATEGEPLFDPDQQPAAPLRQMQRVLGQLHAGIEATRAFIAALMDLKLIEPIQVSLDFKDGEQLRLQGLYSVSQDSLGQLDDAAALRLFRAGHLQLAHTMIGSLRQIARLAELRNSQG